MTTPICDFVRSYAAKNPHPMLFLSEGSYLKWILIALKCETDLSPRYSVTVKSPTEIYGEAEGSVLSESIFNVGSFGSEDTNEAYSVLKERFEYVYPYEKTTFIPSKLSVSKLYPEILDTLEAQSLFESSDGYAIPDLDFFQGNAPFTLTSEFDGKETAEGESDIPDNLPKMKTPSFLIDEGEVTAAEKGIATHIFMQFCEFENVVKNGIENEISRLTEKRFILKSHAEMIDRVTVKKFFDSELFTMLRNAEAVNREYRFNIKLPASDFTVNNALKEQLKDDHIFVQGVIDCYFRDADGRLYLLDYKTDRVPREIRGDSEKELAFFTERYSSQLSYYKKALEKLTGERVYKTFIYSFALGKTVTLV